MQYKYELVEEDTIEMNGVTLYRIRSLRKFSDVKKGELGGFVEKESNLSHEGNCWIYGNAKVFEDAKVKGNAKVEDEALVYGKAHVYGNAKVQGGAKVYGNAVVHYFANVFDYAQVYGRAIVCGEAFVFEEAKVFGMGMIFGGDTKIYGNAEISGSADIYGDASVGGNAMISSEKDIVWFSNVGSANGVLTVFKGKDGDLIATRGCFCGTIAEFLDKSSQVHDEKTQKEYQLLIEMAKLRILGDDKISDKGLTN